MLSARALQAVCDAQAGLLFSYDGFRLIWSGLECRVVITDLVNAASAHRQMRSTGQQASDPERGMQIGAT